MVVSPPPQGVVSSEQLGWRNTHRIFGIYLGGGQIGGVNVGTYTICSKINRDYGYQQDLP